MADAGPRAVCLYLHVLGGVPADVVDVYLGLELGDPPEVHFALLALQFFRLAKTAVFRLFDWAVLAGLLGGRAVGSGELVRRFVADWRGELALVLDGLQQSGLVPLDLGHPLQLVGDLLPDSALVLCQLLVEGLVERVLDVHQLFLESQVPAFPASDGAVGLAPEFFVVLRQLLVPLLLLEEQVVDPLDLVAELRDPARVFAHQIGPVLQMRLALPIDLMPTAQAAFLLVVELLGQPGPFALQVLVLVLQQLDPLLEFFDVEVVLVSVHEAAAHGTLG